MGFGFWKSVQCLDYNLSTAMSIWQGTPQLSGLSILKTKIRITEK